MRSFRLDRLEESPEAGQRVSTFARLTFWLGFVGIGLSFLLVPPLAVIVMGAVARRRIYRRASQLKGVGYANWAVSMGTIGLVYGFLMCLSPPFNPRAREMSHRSACAENVRATTQALQVYAEANGGSFPVVAYGPYEAVGEPRGEAVAGSVTASVWKLVVEGHMTPKAFLCMSDPAAVSAAARQDGAGKAYGDFQGVGQLSYSFAYPWRADGAVGGWWKETGLADLPLVSDMAPEQGTGANPVKDVAGSGVPATTKACNSANHLGDGQNVGFADGHAEFVRRPDVGQKKDNIWTSAGEVSEGPREFGGVPGNRTHGPLLMAEKEPFDVVMYPVRNATTGR